MADLHKAIRTIHSNAVTINGYTKDDTVAVDANGNNITIDWKQVEAWTDPNEYQYKRAAEYPSVKDQLDKIYHDGVDKWKEEMIKPIKDKYPKG
jgi:hypothetical protein|tara:strand:- start:5414 stop:5695 length:282 start_codon:yes stop_codon:yes gene_type:complete